MVTCRMSRTSRRQPITVGVAQNDSHWPMCHFADTDKTQVMNWIGDLIKAGHAEGGVLSNGNIELRFITGEIYHLGDKTVTRVG